MDYRQPPDEHNPYAAPEASFGRANLGGSLYGDAPISEPNPAARVRTDVIGEAWGLFKEKMSTWILLILVTGVCMFGSQMIVAFGGQFLLLAMGVPPQPQNAGEIVPFVLLQIGQVVINSAVQAFFVAGLFRTAIKQVRGLPIEVSDGFQGGDVWLSMFGGILLVLLATMAGMALCIIPGLYVAARLMFTQPLIADARLKAIDAMNLSWRALKGQVFMAFIFTVGVAILSGIGVLLCGVGLLFTLPLFYLSFALLYRDFFLSNVGKFPHSGQWIDKPGLAPEL